uniref:dATP/dGTP diphosphohydrolase N-terminal domain-containing protein n=1 Tax=Dinoroseobacter phage vB_DshS_R26L TaxID=3161158 RepID=A0AAU7VGK4_9CAUD
MQSKDTNPKDALGVAKWRQFMTVPRQVLWELGVAMLEGALKYGRHNYRASGVRASVYLDAAYGHLDQFCEGENVDQDSGLSHVTKAIASLVVLRDAMMNDFWVDDRPPAIKDLDGVRDFLQAKVVENLERYADKDPHHYTQQEDGAPYQSLTSVLDEFADVNLGSIAFPDTEDSYVTEDECDEYASTGVDEDDDLLTALAAMFACGREVTGEYNKVGDLAVMTFHIEPDEPKVVNIAGDVEVVFEDPSIFAGFADGGVMRTVKPISEWDLKVGEHVVLEEDTNIYPKGTEFVVESIPDDGRQYAVLRTLDGKHAGSWSFRLFSKVGPRVGEAGPEFVMPRTSVSPDHAWNATDEDFENEDILATASRVSGIPPEMIVRIEDGEGNCLYQEGQPIAGLYPSELDTLRKMRAAGGLSPIDTSDEVAEAVALKQWARSVGIPV